MRPRCGNDRFPPASVLTAERVDVSVEPVAGATASEIQPSQGNAVRTPTDVRVRVGIPLA